MEAQAVAAEGDEGDTHPSVGQRVHLGNHELEDTNKRILASCIRFDRGHFFIARDQPVELVFFRLMFNQLKLQCKVEPPEEESVPLESFARVFERFFFLLREAKKFNIKDYDDDGDGWVTWSEFFQIYRDQKITVRLSLCEMIFYTLEDSDSSAFANFVSMAVLLVIVVSSFCFIFSTVSYFQDLPEDGSEPKPLPVLETIDSVCLACFCVEYILRLATCWNVRTEMSRKNQNQLLALVVGYGPIKMASPLIRVLRFFFAPANLVDLAAIFPGVLGAFVNIEGGGFVVLRLIRLTRLFRVFKSRSFIEPIIIIGRTLQQSTSALYILVFNLLLGVVISGSLIYIVEGIDKWDEETQSYLRRVGNTWNGTAGKFEEEYDQTPFTSIPHSFWWSLVTIMTVGYGDHYPVTGMGKVVAAGTMVFSLVMLALPVGVVGGNFSQVWAEFELDKQKEQQMIREEQKFVTTAMQNLAPEKLCRMMMVEIWDDLNLGQDGGNTRPHPFRFMGEASCLIDVPMDATVSKTLTMRLVHNPDIVERGVKGKIVVKYVWTPSQGSSGQSPDDGVAPGRTKTQEFSDLRGSLEVTIESASGLLNLLTPGTTGSEKRKQVSSPYCMVFVYPQRPADGAVLRPVVWRTPTALRTLNPSWKVTDSFDYDWTPTPKQIEDPAARPKSPVKDPSSNGADNEARSNILDKALELLKELHDELKQVRETVKQVDDRVNSLDTVVGETNPPRPLDS